MFEFIQRFFGKPPSSATAKERLRLVLLSDHLSLAPDVVEALKHDLIEVISRYVDVDTTNMDVTFEQQEKQVAMLANIPILGMRSRPKPPAPPPPAPTPLIAPEPEIAPSLDLGGASAAVAEPKLTAELQTQNVVEPQLEPQPQPAASTPPANGRGKRRRKRQPASTGPVSGQATPGFSGI